MEHFANVADGKGKSTDTIKPVCKRCFKSGMTKRANKSNLAKHVADRHANLFKEFKELQVYRLAIDNIKYPPVGIQARFFLSVIYNIYCNLYC